MNRSHLLPATLLALAAVAIAQSTQNQSNIARLVNVINQVTAKVDGVIPLREHVTVNLADGGPTYTVPDGYNAQVVAYSIDEINLHATLRVTLLGDTVGSRFLTRVWGGGNLTSSARTEPIGMVLPAGSELFVTGGPADGILVTLALEEI